MTAFLHLLAQVNVPESGTQLSVAGLVCYVVIKEAFGFVKSKNGNGLEKKLDSQAEVLTDIRDGVRELVVLERTRGKWES